MCTSSFHICMIEGVYRLTRYHMRFNVHLRVIMDSLCFLDSAKHSNSCSNIMVKIITFDVRSHSLDVMNLGLSTVENQSGALVTHKQEKREKERKEGKKGFPCAIISFCV